MKTFLTKHKQVLLECLIFAAVCALVIVIFNFNEITFGQTKRDFMLQHIRFIDYLRNSFWETKNLAMQVTFNYGTSQNMANLFYYGQYNPLIMLSYGFPFINTMYWMQIMYFIISVATFVSMNILLRRFNIKRSIVIIISIMIAFCPPLLHHFSYHIMFIYYFPVMIVSLISLDILIKDNIKWPFIICIALIFYTNFYFALIIGFMQLVFFISCLFYRYCNNKKEKIERIKALIISYLVGILIGILSFLPQAFAVITGSRAGDSELYLNFFNIERIQISSAYAYSAGLGMIILFVLIISLINLRCKFTRLISICIIAVLLIDHLNYLLNVFQYVHDKISIYMIPLAFLCLAIILNDEKIKYKKQTLSLLTLIFIYFCFKKYEILSANQSSLLTENDFLIYLIMQFIILLLLCFKRTENKLIILLPLTIVYVVFTAGFSTTLISHKEFQNKVLVERKKKENFYNEEISGFYRTLNKLNFTGAINEFSPLMYTSIINKNYIDFLNYTTKLEISSSSNRAIKNNTFSNFLMKNLFSIKYDYYNVDEDKKQNEIRPFIYGVNNSDSYNTSSLLALDKVDRLLALNQGFFSESSNQLFKGKNSIQTFYVSANNLSFRKKTKVRIDIPENFQRKGIILVESEVISENIEAKGVVIGNHSSFVRPYNFYGDKERRQITIYYDIDKNDKYLDIIFKESKNIYSPLRISFIDYKEVKNNSFKYIDPTNQKVDYNNYYSFTLNMEEAGYLGTSIFYDEGFIIKVNGKEIEKEKVNNNFLGAKLEKGKHDIIIDYRMSGFREGIILTIVGLVLLGIIIIRETKAIIK